MLKTSFNGILFPIQTTTKIKKENVSMEMPEYLKLIEEMNNPETTLARRTEITLTLTDDYKQEQDRISSLSTEKETNEKMIQDLNQSHAILLRKTGILQTDSEQQVKTLQHSETVTLEMIEGGK